MKRFLGPSKKELMEAISALQEQNEALKGELWAQTEKLRAALEEFVETAKDDLIQKTDARIWQSEESAGKRLEELSKSLDARIWKSEEGVGKRLEELNKSLDARIWKSEEDIGKRLEELSKGLDVRIWQSEEGAVKRLKELSESLDARVWKSEEGVGKRLEELSKSLDTRIWRSEEDGGKRLEELNKSLDARIWKTECLLREEIGGHDQSERILDETHRHIDFTYRDLMVALQQQRAFLPENKIKLETDHPIAYESLDHLYPHGTIRDNTRYPRFVEKCETLLAPKTDLAFLDLGCSGGGMVLEAALRGHISMGLEGSDCSKKEQRAEWRLLGDRLQTCDITKPFCLRDSGGEVRQFDIITAWEVLEHIAEADLPGLFDNIKRHLADDGIFVGSIANWDDIDPESGVNWHVTVHPYDWWKEKFEAAGFSICTELFDVIDLARGGYNPPHCYEAPCLEIDTKKSFHIVVRKVDA